ncbi:hypothetical protein GCM10007989_26140 [Devosia pacifica]|uniref:DUF3168 domain-containing protein n=1 Tax=Devosia pacifica TaxID=1335967 RepID=A0A918SAC3_9HYPH|nr:DUF3168 domain-containing protein [Devosia pacifica]GHA29334.1 hypothetical protein GCM10007989_26140 [Devosia pacifica]
MTHPITALQTAMLAALNRDSILQALLGDGSISDAPSIGESAPCIAIARHDIRPYDGDAAPGHEHTLVLSVWHPDADRAAISAIIARVLAVLGEAELSSTDLCVIAIRHQRTRTETEIRSGAMRALVQLRAVSEPH